MTPALSFQYQSGGGNGWLGAGWGLEVGSVERETKLGVNYTDDKYVFHSSEGLETLVAQGATYATEIAARFEKFEKRTASDGRPFWVVTDTHGTVREYGTTPASRQANPGDPSQIFAWRLSRITDTLGNAIVLAYASDGGSLYLQRIDYTESPGLAATNTITFETEQRPDVETSYQLGFLVRTALRLTRVLVDANGHRMPSLQLSYGASQSDATGRSLLRSITVVAADGSRLPPTLYRYQGGPYAPELSTRAGGPAPKDTIDRQCIAADFTGDSLTDVACYSGSNGNWSLTTPSAGGTAWTTTTIAGPAPGNATSQCLAGDLNGDSRSDLLCYTTVGGQWHRMLGSATGWGDSAFVQASAPSVPVSAQCILADLNGDGRADLACAKGGTTWEWSLSQGDTFAPTITVQGPLTNSRNVATQCVAGDFDADGRKDIACYPGSGDKWQRGISTGSNGWTTTIVSGPVPGNPIGNRCLFADFNGDRRMDMLCYAGSGSSGNQWYMAAATATGFDAAISFVGPQTTSEVGRSCVAMDLNGDGKADLTCYQAPGNWRTFLSTGMSFRDAGARPGPTLASSFFQECVAGDFNGDGKGDFTCHASADSWHMYLSDGVTPDLMSGTTSVFGGQTSFEYSRAATMGSIPVPLDVVTKLTVDDGNGQKVSTSVAYSGGYYSVLQHDFRGFRTARITGPQTGGVGATTVIRYHQGSSTDFGADDPEATGAYMRGRLDRIRIFDAANTLLRETTFAYAPSAAIPRFNPPVETQSMICERNVCAGTHVVRQYDRFGNVVKIEDYGDTSSADDDVTTIITYAYNEASYLVSLPASEEVLAGVPATQRLNYTRYFYDSTDTCAQPSTNAVPTRGLVTRVVHWVGDGIPDVEERAAFDEIGNVVCSADPLGNRTTLTYDLTKQFARTSTNALGQPTTITYYGVGNQTVDKGLYGLPRSVRDANGATTITEWDVFGRKTKVTSPTGVTTSWTYANLGVPVQQSLQTQNGGLSTTTFIDGLGRPILTRRSGPQLKFIRTTVHFNERGLPDTASLPYFDGSSSPGGTHVIYDALRRPVEETDPAGGRRTTCYGRGTKDVIDENGHRTRTTTSATGRILQVARYGGVFGRDCAAIVALNDTPYSITQYRQDPLGRLLRIVDAKGVATSISWDGLNRRTALFDPTAGERHFTFDAAGNETSLLSPSGVAVFIQYDALGRPVQKDYRTKKPLGAGNVLNIYDEAGKNGVGRLTGTKTASSTRSLAYDLEGRPVSIDHVIDGMTYHEGRVYDSLGRISELIYPDGRHVMQLYDGPVLASVASGSVVGVPYAALSSYNAAGFPQQIQFGNNTRTSLTYETPSNPECPRPTYRLCSTTTFAPNNAVKLQLDYDYDTKGNIASVREPGLARSFIYDEFDRLRAVASSTTNVVADQAYRNGVLAAVFPRDWASLSQPSSTIALSEAFDYNNADDLTWKFDVGSFSYPTPLAAAMNPHAPRQAGSDALTWDSEGNLAYAPGRSMAYDPEGRLAAVSVNRGKGRIVAHSSDVYQYDYESDGSRLRESGPNGATVYIGSLAECHVGGSCVDHIFAGSARIASIAADGRITYFQQDALGSTRIQSDGFGIVNASYSYASYGAPSVTSGASPGYLPTSFLFSGQPFTSGTGLYLFGGRAYDPRLGRFLSPDSQIPAPGSMECLNRYNYAFNNPSSMIDPDGHFAFLVGIFIGAILGAILGGAIAHFEHLDWRQGALIGAITGAFLSFSGSFGLSTLEKAAVDIATGGLKGGYAAWQHGGNIGKGILHGFLTGGLDALRDQFVSIFTIPDSIWGTAPSQLERETDKFANAALHGAASGVWGAVASGGSIRSGVLRGVRNGVLGELRGEIADHATSEAKTLLSEYDLVPDSVRGAFVYKTPFFGSLDDAATQFIHKSAVAGQIKPSDLWAVVQSQARHSDEAHDALESVKAAGRSLETTLGIDWAPLNHLLEAKERQ